MMKRLSSSTSGLADSPAFAMGLPRRGAARPAVRSHKAGQSHKKTILFMYHEIAEQNGVYVRSLRSGYALAARDRRSRCATATLGGARRCRSGGGS